MRRLSFKKAYIAPIISGDKTQTLRRPQGKIAVGDELALTCVWGQPPFAIVTVSKVETLPVADLRPEHAYADGFDSLEEMHAAIRLHYPGLREVEVITFSSQVQEQGEQREAQDHRSGLEQQFDHARTGE